MMVSENKNVYAVVYYQQGTEHNILDKEDVYKHWEDVWFEKSLHYKYNPQIWWDDPISQVRTN